MPQSETLPHSAVAQKHSACNTPAGPVMGSSAGTGSHVVGLAGGGGGRGGGGRGGGRGGFGGGAYTSVAFTHLMMTLGQLS